MNLWMSIRRTVIPYLVGWVLSLPLGGLFTEGELTTLFTVVLGTLYYAAARWAEEQGYQWASWFVAFGPAPTPHYDTDTGVVSDVPAGDRIAKDSGDGSVADE
jgi:hypothetical protein